MERPKCKVDGCIRVAELSRILKNGEQGYKSRCTRCRKGEENYKRYQKTTTKRRMKKDPDKLARLRERTIPGVNAYRAYKGTVCVACGFVPEHPCQLDVDHINGVHSDSRPENLQTLCANCHRLKSWKQRMGML